MVKGHTLGLMDKSMLENGRMRKRMVKEQCLYLMEKSMLGNSRMEDLGILLDTTKTEISSERW